MNIAKTVFHRLGRNYLRTICAREYNQQSFLNVNERPVEFAYVFRHLVNSWPKSVLDVGTGMTALPHLMRNCGFLVTSTDNIEDYWPIGMVNRHYHVINDDITDSDLKTTFDTVTCISVMEHIQNHRQAMKSIYSLLNPGGRLIITFPYNEKQYAENVYLRPESTVTEKYSFVTQAYSRKEVDGWIADSGYKLVDQEYWRFFEGEYWTCGPRTPVPLKVGKGDTHQLSCLVLEKQSF